MRSLGSTVLLATLCLIQYGCYRGTSEFPRLTTEHIATVAKTLLGSECSSDELRFPDWVSSLNELANQRNYQLVVTDCVLESSSALLALNLPSLLVSIESSAHLLLVDVESVDNEVVALVQDCLSGQFRVITVTDTKQMPFDRAISAVPLGGQLNAKEFQSDESLVVADRNWRSVGYIEPFTRTSTSFRLTNQTSEPLVVMRVASSCTCIVSNIEQGAVVGPGETREVAVTLGAGDREVVTEWVQLGFGNSAGSKVRQLVTMEATGWSTRTMIVLPPDVINLGRTSSSFALATVRLLETQFDRFRPSAFEFGGVEVPFELEETTVGGLRQYVARIQLDLPATIAGHEVSESLSVLTTSKWRDSFDLDVRWQRESGAEARPSILDFGVIRDALPGPKLVQFRSRDGAVAPWSLAPQNRTTGFRVTRNDVGGMLVEPVPTSRGFCSAEIGVLVDSSTSGHGLPAQELVNVTCSYLCLSVPPNSEHNHNETK